MIKKADYDKNEDKFFRLLYPSINTLLDKFGFEHKVIEALPNVIVTYEGKRRESDFIGLLDNGDIINIEAHSSPITLEDKKKFFDYASYYSIKNQKDNIKVHTLVLSSYYKSNDIVKYEWHGSSQFTIPYKSFNTFNAEKTINKISLKNKNKEKLNKYEIDDLRILTFMQSDKSHKELLIESVKLTNEAIMDSHERVYTKALQFFLAKKFIKDEEEYEEVMKMIQKYNEEFGGVFDRMENIIEKRVEKRVEQRVEQRVRKEEQEKGEKKVEKVRKEEQEKTERVRKEEQEKINNILNELKKRGINEEDIKAISELAK